MLKKLPKSKYKVIQSFLINPHLKLNIQPILNYSFPGIIYVDDIENPTLAYIWDSRVAHFLIGDWANKEIYNHLIDFLQQKIVPTLKNEKKNYYLIYTNSWKDVVENTDEFLFPDPVVVERQLYRFKESQITNCKNDIPEEFELLPVSKELIKLENIENLDGLLNELKYMWGEPERFFEHSFGYCIKTEEKLVGWCLGEYFSENEFEKMFGIGIEVYPEFQRKGFATLLTSALVKEGETRGYKIYWDCSRDNIGSVKTALKAGFKLIEDYVIYQGTFDEFSRYTNKAWLYSRQNDYLKAIESYKQALEINPSVDWVYWNIAVLFKRLKNLNSAFAYLEYAVNNGWANIKYMEQSEHFRDVHNDSRWLGIISKIQKPR